MKDKGQEKKRRAFWQARLDDARRQYAEKRERMDRREDCYKGTRHIPAAGGGAAKAAGNVRNIIYELIESQVDASIPQPRVTAVHPEDRQLAKKIEAMLLAQIRQRNFKEMNDEQERTVPIQGGDFWHVEWDPEGGFHCQMGDLSVELRHPKQVIPQPGVYDLEKMDYLFVLVSQSRRALEKRYGVRLPEEGESDVAARTSEEESSVEGLVTQNIAYYRNSAGGVGCFSWVGDVTLEDMEDYQSRRLVHGLHGTLAVERERFARLAAALDALSPLKVLSRGYALTTDGAGRVLASVSGVEPGDNVTVRLADGALRCRGEAKQGGENDGGKKEVL